MLVDNDEVCCSVGQIYRMLMGTSQFLTRLSALFEVTEGKKQPTIWITHKRCMSFSVSFSLVSGDAVHDYVLC